MAEKRESEMTRHEMLNELAIAVLERLTEIRTSTPLNGTGGAVRDAMLAAASRAGFALVPREATPDMLWAMGQAADFHIPVGSNRAVVWSAMLAEAEKR